MPISTATPKVFVSYSHADIQQVLPLVDRLEEETGVHFWVDLEGIESAAQFEEVIVSAIDQAEVVLFMLSDNSQHSQWTKDEISYAKNTGKRVVPIVLHGGGLKGWFLFKFGRINYIDATQGEQIQRLAADIREWLHVRKEQAPHVGRANFTETIKVSDIPGASESNEKPKSEQAPGASESNWEENNTDVKPKGNALLLFIRKHRVGCTFGLTIALTICVVIVVVFPQMFLVSDKPPIIESSSEYLETVKCPNCNGAGTVRSNDITLTCIACCGRGVITEETPMGIARGHIYVDLGLSVRWATCNVGTNSPQKGGTYFAWAETSPKITYTPGNSTSWHMEGTKEIAGNDTLDAARANWGGSWRLPTETEAQELIDDCTWEWTDLKGQAGCRVTGPSGLSIFLPACGLKEEESLSSVGEFGGYWTSSALIKGVAFAIAIDRSPFRVQLPSASRYVGYTVRPVCE